MARSPNYPGVDLKFAVERAERLWTSQQGHAAAKEVVMKNLGYAPVSGAGSVTLGAMKRFGLVEEAEKGRARLTKLGMKIVRGETTGERAHTEIREAALQPLVHREIWEKYGADLPDDSVLEFDLVDQGFTHKGAKEFLAQWKRTVSFAKLADSSVSLTGDDGETDGDLNVGESSVTPSPVAPPSPTAIPPTAPAAPERHFPIPLITGEDAALTVPPTMTEESWQQMLKVIDAMKPGIVRPVRPSASEPGPLS